MWRDERDKEKVPLHLMPGFVDSLHQYKHGQVDCDTCEMAWPCPGARRQLADAARFTNPFWLSNERFAVITRESAAVERAEATRRAKKARKAAEASSPA